MLPPEGVKCYCKELEMEAGSGLDSRDRIPTTEFQNWEVILYVAGGGRGGSKDDIPGKHTPRWSRRKGAKRGETDPKKGRSYRDHDLEPLQSLKAYISYCSLEMVPHLWNRAS